MNLSWTVLIFLFLCHLYLLVFRLIFIYILIRIKINRFYICQISRFISIRKKEHFYKIFIVINLIIKNHHSIHKYFNISYPKRLHSIIYNNLNSLIYNSKPQQKKVFSTFLICFIFETNLKLILQHLLKIFIYYLFF